MTRSIRIGGEFEIDSMALSNVFDSKTESKELLFSSGRAALMAILLYLFKKDYRNIYIPFYICTSVVEVCERSGFKTKFYEINDDFLFPIELTDDIDHNAVVLFVNYFGFINTDGIIQSIKASRTDIITICDNVQSFWTYNESNAHFSFTSLRKHIGTPDGALIFSNDPGFRPQDYPINTFFWPKLLGSILKHYRVEDNIYLNLFSEGEERLNSEIEVTKSSRFGKHLYNVTDWNKVKQKRQQNANRIYEFGKHYGLDFIFDYNPDVVPLFVPIRVKNRDRIREKLRNLSIYLPVHWPAERYNHKSMNTQKMITQELSLIIDQRYSLKEIDYQLECLIKLIDLS